MIVHLHERAEQVERGEGRHRPATQASGRRGARHKSPPKGGCQAQGATLQWIPGRRQAIAEFTRVLRPGGRLMCCNFDDFGICHYPVDDAVQADVEHFFQQLRERRGFDNLLGRRLGSLFKDAGLVDIRVDFVPDAAFGGYGGDPERRWNWEKQFTAARDFLISIFGSPQRAELFIRRTVNCFSNPGTYVYCPLFYVQGYRPEM